MKTETANPTVGERVTRVFIERFGHEPDFAAQAPGRVNLIGEHTDYSGGFVLPIAIGRGCVCAGKVTTEMGGAGVLRVASGDTGTSAAVQIGIGDGPRAAEGRGWESGAATRDGDPGAVRRGSWLSYIVGVVAQMKRLPGWPSDVGLDLAVAGDVPRGAGLASSAALEVSVATALEAGLGIALEPVDKALLCQRAEHEFAGVPCGIMDQFVSVMGMRDHALLIDCRSLEAKPIRLPPSQPASARRPPGRPGRNAPALQHDRAVFVVINSGVRHELASGEYATRRAACASAAKKLGIKELRNATLELIEKKLASVTDEERRYARHVVTENDRTIKAARALENLELVEAGALMNASHDSLRDDFRVSCRELDVIVDLARRVDGVYGARMTGGGFGGCVVAMVRPEAADRVGRHVLKRYRDLCNRRGTSLVTGAVDGCGTVAVVV